MRRLLYILPRALGPEGARIDDVADELQVSPATVEADVRELVERAYDHRPGLGDDIQVELEAGWVRVRTTGDFQRPVRLDLREALCLGIGLRIAALSPSLDAGKPQGAPAGSEEMEAATLTSEREELRKHLENHLASVAREGLHSRIAAPDLDADPSTVRNVLFRAARESRKCVIRYLKPGARQPDERRIHPYELVYAEGRWYILAYCEDADAVRSFRTDRTLTASLLGEEFDVPADFDPAEHVSDGRVLRSGEATHASVRYSPRIARWIAERDEGQWDFAGGLIVRHPVADPEWLVRHVLSYAGEAEIIEPPELREMTRCSAEAIARLEEISED